MTARTRLAALAMGLAVTVAHAANGGDAALVTEAAATETTVFPVLFTPGDCQSYRFIASQVWPEIDTPAGPTWAWVTRIMRRESRCLPDVVNLRGRDRSYGLLQVNTRGALWDQPIGWGLGPLKTECGLTVREDLLNPAVNLACARVLWMARGAQPWA